MDCERLSKVVASMESRGVDVSTLRSIEIELAVNDRPPGFLGKFRQKAKVVLRAQWQNLRGEAGETNEAFVLLVRRFRKKQPLHPAEADKVRAQLVDLVKMVPAGVLATANAAMPIPGTSVFTPMLLSKMGLMPSRWRNAHVLRQLRREAKRLRAEGHSEEADELDAFRGEVEVAADEREKLSRNADLLTQWDANDSGEWEDDEKATYRQELERLRGLLLSKGMRKRWFLRLGSETWGPVRISALLPEAEEMDEDLLVCYDGRTGWVDLQDLQSGQSQV